MLKISILVILFAIFSLSLVYFNHDANASPFFSNGYFTPNGIEWCEENLPLYKILGDKFFEHHRHSIESRICVSLFNDYYWTYDGSDRVKKLIERSKYYSQLEISESHEESVTGLIDTNPAENKNQTLLRGITEDGELIVQIISSSPKKNQTIELNLSFLNMHGKLVSDINYGINVTQQGTEVLRNENVYSEKGVSTLITRPLSSDEPVLIKIFNVRIGNPNSQGEFFIAKGDVLEFTVVPEFGPMVIMLFGIMISLVILVNLKNRTSIKF